VRRRDQRRVGGVDSELIHSRELTPRLASAPTIAERAGLTNAGLRNAWTAATMSAPSAYLQRHSLLSDSCATILFSRCTEIIYQLEYIMFSSDAPSPTLLARTHHGIARRQVQPRPMPPSPIHCFDARGHARSYWPRRWLSGGGGG